MHVFSYFIVVGFLFISIFGIIGNSFTIYVFKPKRNRSKLKQMNLLIFYLAIIDLVSSILNPSLFVYWEITQYSRWDFGEFLCSVLPSFRKISMVVSLGVILLITMERALVISNFQDVSISCRKINVFVFATILASIFTEINYVTRLQLSPKEFNLRLVCDHVREQYQERNSITAISDEHGGSVIFLYSTSYSCDEIKAKRLTAKDITSNRKFTNEEHVNKTLLRGVLMSDINAKCQISCNPMQATCELHSTKVTAYINLCTVILRYLIALTIVIVSNVFIYKAFNDKDQINILQNQSFSEKSKGVFRLLVAMATVFFCLVLPKEIFEVVYQFLTFNDNKISFHFSAELNAFLALVQTCNCVSNIFIYARLHKRFRATYSESLRRISLRFSFK